LQMDQATQQNAALVEEAAAAADSMQEQAHQLADLVGIFQTGEPAAGATRASQSRTGTAVAVRATALRTPAPAAAAKPPAKQAAVRFKPWTTGLIRASLPAARGSLPRRCESLVHDARFRRARLRRHPARPRRCPPSTDATGRAFPTQTTAGSERPVQQHWACG